MRRALCILVTIAVLFSQLALAAYPCPMPANAPVAGATPGDGDCCGGRSPLCGASCMQASQAPDRPLATHVVPPASSVIAGRGPTYLLPREAAVPRSALRSVLSPGPGPALHNRLRI
jgi:hypothetical protein